MTNNKVKEKCKGIDEGGKEGVFQDKICGELKSRWLRRQSKSLH